MTGVRVGSATIAAVIGVGIALPTAQNVFVIASRHDRAALLSRDAIFVRTLACVPAIMLTVALLG